MRELGHTKRGHEWGEVDEWRNRHLGWGTREVNSMMQMVATETLERREQMKAWSKMPWYV